MTSDTSPTARVVVGFDGSDAALEALGSAARMASLLKAKLEVVQAWHYPTSYGGFPIGASWAPDEDATLTLRAGLHRCFGREIPSWVEARIAEGQPARVLLRASRGAEMLVVGSRGHGGFAGLLLGSVSSACAEHATCPVLVVHSDAHDAEARAATAHDDDHAEPQRVDLEATVPL
ncbi:Universal stress protein [Frondihabitans sp. 762G35]|uniref:universal stress protein n=1 Tax=Frondihabitans sp. 762G35 TaxID=1446794 RepID=UPI000D209B86|nr:universal stress protein [Frondihabitans sp. 762G35]ARC57997.1 Universal stress protein [Frondihabitans sp. 762G35]